MTIIYTTTRDLSPSQLDELFTSIAWPARGEHKWKEVLSKTSYICTAWSEGKIIGMGRIVEDGVMCMIYDVAIHPQHQKKGIGTKIMNMILDQVRNKEYSSVRLFAWKGNPHNTPFYEKLGFTKTLSAMELDQERNNRTQS